MRRVVVTGMGIISPIGSEIEEVRKNLKEGYCGISEIDLLEDPDLKLKYWGYCYDFDPEGLLTRKEIGRMDRVTQLGLYAAKKAIEDSQIDFDDYDRDRVATVIGSGVGGFDTIEEAVKIQCEKGICRLNPLTIPMVMANRTANEVAIRYGLHGESQTPVAACATGTNAILNGYRAIKDGYADCVISGGAEAADTLLGIGSFQQIKALSKAESLDRASIPFDAERSGFVPAEGAGILVLEEYEHALKRGAKIYAEIAGGGITCDAYHITAPNPDGVYVAKAMENAIKERGHSLEDIDYINAHGTSTAKNDQMETNAIKYLFKDRAKDVAISSTKSMTGHLLGAAGAVEAIFTILAIRDSFIPPTINLKVPDEELDLNYTANKAVEKEVNYALSNSCAFGGSNVALLFKKVED